MPLLPQHQQDCSECETVREQIECYERKLDLYQREIVFPKVIWTALAVIFAASLVHAFL